MPYYRGAAIERLQGADNDHDDDLRKPRAQIIERLYFDVFEKWSAICGVSIRREDFIIHADQDRRLCTKKLPYFTHSALLAMARKVGSTSSEFPQFYAAELAYGDTLIGITGSCNTPLQIDTYTRAKTLLRNAVGLFKSIISCRYQ